MGKLDLSGALDFFLREFENELQMQISSLVGISKSSLAHRPAALRGFLSAPAQGNIRIVPSTAGYPTVGSMVTDMEERRDISENLMKLKSQNMELSLFKVGNSMAKRMLSEAVGHVAAQVPFRF